MSLVVDLLSICSVIGIWPRFIEPKLLKVTELEWKLDKSSNHLEGLKILHLTDLHFHRKMSQKFLDKIALKASILKPDLILFTGDFLCYSKLEDEKRLLSFLCELKAPLGSFCILGNHDYAKYVTLNNQGVYDLLAAPNPLMGIFRAARILFSKKKIGIDISPKVLSVEGHNELINLLEKTPFKLLENKTLTLPLGLNLCGLGDLALGRCCPESAFENYNPKFPGIILSHNPDSFPKLLKFPGSWILSGHTHGEQIHIPWPKWGRKISQKLARLENSEYTRGIFTVGDKKMYVNRGLGCHKPFRFLSPPEFCMIYAVKA